MKIRKGLACILTLAFCTIFVKAEKIGILEGIFKPAGVAVRAGEVFILEGATVFVFSIDDLRLLRKFGREGQGPGEVEITPWLENVLYVFDDYVVIDSVNKVVTYSLSGTLIKELRRSQQFTQMIPVEKNYTAKKRMFDAGKNMQYSTINWCDPDCQKSRELYRQPFAAQHKKIDMIPDSVHFAVYEDKIFIEESPRGFYIEVFDHNGEKIYAIHKGLEKIPVKTADKREAEKLLSVDPFMSNAPGGWKELKKTLNLNYPEAFPAISDLVITDNKIYVQTYKKERQRQQYIVLDLEGNELSRVLLPEVSPPGFTEQMMGTGVRLFDINHDRFYYIVSTDEGCELYAKEIEDEHQGSGNI
ncbi:MAG: hypothetical protein JXB23_16200 [Candidatus Aminicenantes bacterium]|nr:hypothetical protein [Candidatus Aminicenantes bacterium]